MTQRYLLHCQCGRDLEIGERQAGQEQACSCGKTLLIPTLRQIRMLPPARSAELVRHDSINWSLQQGLIFSAGLLVMFVSLSTLAFMGWQRSQIDLSQPDMDHLEYQLDIDSLSPLDTLEMWSFFATQGLVRQVTPTHIVNRKHAERLALIMAVSGAVAIGGLVLALLALRSPRH